MGFDGKKIKAESHDDGEISTARAVGSIVQRLDYVIQKLNEIIRRQTTFEENFSAAIVSFEKKYDLLLSAVNSVKEAIMPSHGCPSHISFDKSACGSSVCTRELVDFDVNSEELFGAGNAAKKRDVNRACSDRASGSETAGMEPIIDNMEDILEEIKTPMTAGVTSTPKKKEVNVDSNSSKPLRRSSRRMKLVNEEDVIRLSSGNETQPKIQQNTAASSRKRKCSGLHGTAEIKQGKHYKYPTT